jgi:hypothetical protein
MRAPAVTNVVRLLGYAVSSIETTTALNNYGIFKFVTGRR